MVADVLAAILREHAIEDVSVEDPPLDEVIAEVFSLADSNEAEAKVSLAAKS